MQIMLFILQFRPSDLGSLPSPASEAWTFELFQLSSAGRYLRTWCILGAWIEPVHFCSAQWHRLLLSKHFHLTKKNNISRFSDFFYINVSSNFFIESFWRNSKNICSFDFWHLVDKVFNLSWLDVFSSADDQVFFSASNSWDFISFIFVKKDLLDHSILA